MIRTLIIDDEIRARETIQAMLEIYCSENVQVVGRAKNVRTDKIKTIFFTSKLLGYP